LSQSELRVPCEVYSRIVGYLRPVQNWNKGKKQEWEERKTFSIPVSLAHTAGLPWTRYGPDRAGSEQADLDDWAANDPPAWAEVVGR